MKYVFLLGIICYSLGQIRKSSTPYWQPITQKVDFSLSSDELPYIRSKNSRRNLRTPSTTRPTLRIYSDEGGPFVTVGWDPNKSMETLTAEAFAALLAQSPYNDTAKSDEYDPARQEWEGYVERNRFKIEKMLGVGSHVYNEPALVRICYSIANTYLNAMTDMKNYYKLRYLYQKNKQYEIGFMTHEIVHKYQIVLELFHIVQARYVKFRDYAPNTYMFYMYSQILTHCRDIIHLCNMMSQIEKKYKNATAGVFDDYQVADTDNKAANIMMQLQIREMMKDREKQQKQQLKKRKKEMLKWENFFTPSTRKPVKSIFPIHYGWSIESW